MSAMNLPSLDTLFTVVKELKESMESAPFNSDFSHTAQIVKLRAAELEKVVCGTVSEAEAIADAERKAINQEMAKFFNAINCLRSDIAFLRVIRAERCRANYLHCLELKASEEGGAE